MAPITVESTFQRLTADRVRLSIHLWTPAHDPAVGDGDGSNGSLPRALVVMAHGIVEHAGRYALLAARLNRCDIAVWAPDLRGHGLSSGSRAWICRFDQYLDDISLVLSEATAAHPGIPVFLLGHSMGGLIALQPRFASAGMLRGLILSAPALSVADEFAPVLRKLAVFGSRWFPRLRLVRIGSSMMSRDPEVIAQFRSDPLVFHGRIPTRTGAEIIRVGQETRQQAAELKASMLLLQGTADAVVPSGAAEAFFQAVGSGDKTLRLYPGLYHDLPREPEKEEIYTEIANWILARC